MDQTQTQQTPVQNNQTQPAQQQPQIRIEPLLDEVLRRDASDLHLQVGLPPMIRIDGALTKV
jgi:type II secretory ATPase GspE/PulE/Tfp pilus assembly ATPase PilB-like protein